MSEITWTDAEREHAQIAELLCSTGGPPSHGPGGPPVAIPDSDEPRHRIAACYDCQRRATALAPHMAERVRQARAEAWDDGFHAAHSAGVGTAATGVANPYRADAEEGQRP